MGRVGGRDHSAHSLSVAAGGIFQGAQDAPGDCVAATGVLRSFSMVQGPCIRLL